VLENESQCHGLAVHINSGDDRATLLKFGELLPGNSRDDRAYLRTSGTIRPKTGVYSRISPDILDRFSQSIHHMKASALHADDGSVPYFPICQGMFPWQPNNVAVMKANWYYVHSLHVRLIAAWFCFATTC